MKKINFVKLSWVFLIIGTVSFVILIGIAFDVKQNQREEFPVFITYFAGLGIISYIVGGISIIKLLMKKKRKRTKS